ncbi:outer membrane protein [Pseudooceanicola sp. HF7]|uniref:outer membrane protein n=1 Tax=Pseudooceanicola sp. HF7 TaxID=2721560 RepID=UPI0014321F72|nr:outer membrane beta-barrel protein [Pseudooceanicola sp. HF7]NIZ09685.1 porin family protein [Pseudooceanicola sp. HF7]
MASASNLIRASVAGAALAAGLGAVPALAEVELSFYSGYQTAPHSRINGTSPTTGDFSALIGWEGKSFSMPPYYGVRATWWQDSDWGVGLEFSHNKVYSDSGDRAAAGFEHLEFTDGLNIITVNASRRWQDAWNGFTPYVSGGLGIAVPHVEVTAVGGPATYGYQYTGPAARLTAGASYPLNDRWSVFGEYQFTWSDNSADLDGGGNLDTRIYTNALNVGLGFRF